LFVVVWTDEACSDCAASRQELLAAHRTSACQPSDADDEEQQPQRLGVEQSVSVRQHNTTDCQVAGDNDGFAVAHDDGDRQPIIAVCQPGSPRSQSRIVFSHFGVSTFTDINSSRPETYIVPYTKTNKPAERSKATLEPITTLGWKTRSVVLRYVHKLWYIVMKMQLNK